LQKLKILFLILCFSFSGCNSKYYKQNPDTEHYLRENSNILENILLVNTTDTTVYYNYRESASGTRSLFSNNDFIHAFRFEELAAGRSILLRIEKNDVLKIRYKKDKKEIEEKILVYKNQKFEVTNNGIIITLQP
jgi:hypothetical protein